MCTHVRTGVRLATRMGLMLSQCRRQWANIRLAYGWKINEYSISKSSTYPNRWMITLIQQGSVCDLESSEPGCQEDALTRNVNKTCLQPLTLDHAYRVDICRMSWSDGSAFNVMDANLPRWVVKGSCSKCSKDSISYYYPLLHYEELCDSLEENMHGSCYETILRYV